MLASKNPYHSLNIVYKFGPFLSQFIMMPRGLLNFQFQILEKWWKIKYFTLNNIHGSKFRIFYYCLVVVCCFETTLKNLGKWGQRGASVSHLPLNILQKFQKFSFKLLSFSFCSNFQEDWWETCADIRSLLFLCNKELQKKFYPILMVCQRWCHSEKTKTGIAFDLDVIFSVCMWFLRFLF